VTLQCHLGVLRPLSAETTSPGEQADPKSAARHSKRCAKKPSFGSNCATRKSRSGRRSQQVVGHGSRISDKQRNVGSSPCANNWNPSVNSRMVAPFAHYDQTSIHGSKFTASTNTRSHQIDFVTDAS